VQEAIDQYLAWNEARKEQVRAAQAVLGSLSEEEAGALEGAVVARRKAWR
jgi:hypothetical protein